MKITTLGSRAVRMFAAGAIILGMTATVHADLKVTQTIQVDLSNISFQGKPLSASQRTAAEKNSGGLVTLYIKGNKVRLDRQKFVTIMNLDNRTTTFLNNRDHTYWSQPMRPPDYDKVVGGMKVNVKSLGRSQRILGHMCKGYDVTVTSQQPVGNGKSRTLVTKSTLWVAPDVASIPHGLPLGDPQLDLTRDKVKGLPLEMLSVVSNPLGQVGLSLDVKSISTGNLSSSLFTRPSDFKLQQPGPLDNGPHNTH